MSKFDIIHGSPPGVSLNDNDFELSQNSAKIKTGSPLPINDYINQQILRGATGYKTLTAKRNAANPNYQLDITATEIWNGGFYEASFSGTVDITVEGAGGLRAGLSEVNSTWYYCFKWDGPGIASTLQLDTSRFAPVAPAGGYTESRYICPVYNSSAGHFEDFTITDESFLYATIQTYIIGVGSMGSAVDVDCSQWIPEDVVDVMTWNGYSDSNAVGGTVAACDILGKINGSFGYLQGSINSDSLAGASAKAYLSGLWIMTDNRHIKFRGYTAAGGGGSPAYRGDILGFKVRNR